MFGSRDQQKGSTALGEGYRSVPYGDALQIERRRAGAREERDVGSSVKANGK
jgi:hypothetical protein